MPWKWTTAFTALALSLVAIASGSAASGAEEAISVGFDRARVFRIQQPATSIIVGNPDVADAVMHDAHTLVIMGRSFGTTNLIVLNEDNEAIVDEVIIVKDLESQRVTVQRQASRFSYVCNPNCSAERIPGDVSSHFKDTHEQTTARHLEARRAVDGYK